jgi:hypothetical protein
LNHVLLIFNAVEPLDNALTYFLIPESESRLYKMAESINGLWVNCEEEGYTRKQVDFVTNLSTTCYDREQLDPSQLDLFKHIVSEPSSFNQSVSITAIYQCGFAP